MGNLCSAGASKDAAEKEEVVPPALSHSSVAYAFLRELGLERYALAFIAAGYDDM